MSDRDGRSRAPETAVTTRWVEELIPFNRVLGVTGASVDGDRSSVKLRMRDELVGNPTRRTLHGGVISSTLDLVGGMAVMMSILGGQPDDPDESTWERLANIGTINLRVDYLRPGVGRAFEASGFVVRAGNKVVVTRMEFRNEEGVLIATGIGTYTAG